MYRRLGRVRGPFRRPFCGGRLGGGKVYPFRQDTHPLVLAAVFVCPGIGQQAAGDLDELPLSEVVGDELRSGAPRLHTKEVGLFLPALAGVPVTAMRRRMARPPSSHRPRMACATLERSRQSSKSTKVIPICGMLLQNMESKPCNSYWEWYNYRQNCCFLL